MTENKTEEKTEEKVTSKVEEKVETKSENKSRKRKWDDQGSSSDGLITPPNPAIQNSKKIGSDVSTTATTITTTKDAKDPNAIAQVAAQAAKISAMLQAKGISIQSSSPGIPVINNSLVNDSSSTATTTSTTPTTTETSKAKDKVTTVKGEFCKDIEINDLRNRYNLIKASTLTKLQEETKAGIITRGKYYPNKALATEKDPPLYLHVAAATQEILDNALAKIQEIIDSKPITIVPQQDNSNSVFPKPTTSNRYHQEKIFIGIDDRTFNTKLKLIGIQGKNVKHIHYATGAKIQLKGKGSGFIEPTSGQEAFEPMFFQISSITKEGLEKAKQLVEDLINTVKGEYEKFKQYRANRPNIPKMYNSYNQGGYIPYSANPLPPGMYSAPGYSQYNGYSRYAQPPPPPPPMGDSATGAIADVTGQQPPPPPYPPTASTTTSAMGQVPPPSSTQASYYQSSLPQSQMNSQYSYYTAASATSAATTATPTATAAAASYNPYYYSYQPQPPPPQQQHPYSYSSPHPPPPRPHHHHPQQPQHAPPPPQYLQQQPQQQQPPPPLPTNPPPPSDGTTSNGGNGGESTPYQPGNPTSKYE